MPEQAATSRSGSQRRRPRGRPMQADTAAGAPSAALPGAGDRPWRAGPTWRQAAALPLPALPSPGPAAPPRPATPPSPQPGHRKPTHNCGPRVAAQKATVSPPAPGAARAPPALPLCPGPSSRWRPAAALPPAPSPGMLGGALSRDAPGRARAVQGLRGLRALGDASTHRVGPGRPRPAGRLASAGPSRGVGVAPAPRVLPKCGRKERLVHQGI